MALTAAETARRLRAMWGYSLMDQDAFIAELGAELHAGRRLLRRKSPALADEDLLRRAARVAGLPEGFAVDGAQAITDVEDPASTLERVDALEQQMDTVLHLLTGRVAAAAGSAAAQTATSAGPAGAADNGPGGR